MRPTIAALTITLFAMPSLATDGPRAVSRPPEADSILARVDRGNYAGAELVAQRELPRIRAQFGSLSLEYALTVDAAVRAFLKTKAATRAPTLQLAKHSVAIKEHHPEPVSAGLAASLQNLAAVHEARGEYALARAAFHAAVAKLEGTPKRSAELAAALNDFGSLLVRICDQDSARICLERALAVRQSMEPDGLPVAQTLNALGLFYASTAEFLLARQSYERALAIRERLRPVGHPEIAGPCNNLGILLTRTGDYEEALKYLERALAIRIAALPPKTPVIGSTTANLAWLHYRRGNINAADSLYQQALRVYSNSVGLDHPMVASALLGFAKVHQRQRKFAEARQDLARALRIRTRAFGHRSHDTADCLLALSELEEEAGDLRAAGEFGRSAIVIQRDLFGPEHYMISAHLASLARIDAKAGRQGRAVASAVEAESIARRHARLLAQSLPEQDALRLVAARDAGMDVALTLAADGVDGPSRRAICDMLVRSRGLVLDMMAARRHLVSDSNNPRIQEEQRRVAAVRARIANLIAHPPEHLPANYREHLANLQRQRERAERQLAESSGSRLEEPPSVGLSDVETTLQLGEILVSYAVFERAQATYERPTTLPFATARSRANQEYVAFVHRVGRHHPTAHALGKVTEIDSLVQAWLEDSAPLRGSEIPPQRTRSSRAAGDALRQRIWDPLEPEVERATRVLVVPDGALNLVNLYALPIANGSYLVETVAPIELHSAERDLMYRHSSTSSVTHLLALGGADFNAEADRTQVRRARATSTPRSAPAFRSQLPDCPSFRSRSFEPLPASEQEVREVTQAWCDSGRRPRDSDCVALCLTGEEASEAAFRELAPEHKWLHVASHAFFVGEDCALSADPTRGVVATRPLEQPGPANPLRLCGLALSGANQRLRAPDGIDDGVLTAEEISLLDLRGACVVLSGCATGTGDVLAGEGVFGLRRAFQVAGATSLLLSLWEIQDQMAHDWMRAFYANQLVGKLDLVDAVRQTTVMRLEAHRRQGTDDPPSGWAAFVATGNARP